MRARTTELAVTGLAPLSYNVAHCCQYSSPAKALVAIPAIWLGRTSYGFGAATRTPDPAPWRRRPERQFRPVRRLIESASGSRHIAPLFWVRSAKMRDL